MDENKQTYQRAREICECNSLLKEYLESKEVHVKEGTVFTNDGKCLGTIWQIYQKKKREEKQKPEENENV